MRTRVDEIAAGIFRLATALPDADTTINQFLIDAEEPLLYHCGSRRLFASVCEAVGTILALHRLRWISFGHVGAVDIGAMNLWLAVAPRAQLLHSPLGCGLSIDDLADRVPRRLPDDGKVELGGRRVRMIETPHVPRNWKSIMLFEEVTATLFCGDLGANGRSSDVWTDDLVRDALAFHERHPGSMACSSTTSQVLERLAELAPRQLAVMRGASWRGDGASELRRLARHLPDPAGT